MKWNGMEMNGKRVRFLARTVQVRLNFKAMQQLTLTQREKKTAIKIRQWTVQLNNPTSPQLYLIKGLA